MNAARARRLEAGALAVAALFALGIAVRVYGAWCYRHGVNLDHATIALMVKHMVEGVGFPVFFYGQAFMGSLEPMVSAVLARVFGLSGFMVGMGPAVLGIALAFAVYRWTRAMAGRTAGAAALLFLTIGPRGYFHYLASPRCYAIQMLLTVLMLWLCAHGVRRIRRGDAFPSAVVFAWGVLAGLGWWASGLILFTVGACVLLAVLACGRRLWNPRWAWAALGALLGAAPWWIWNLRNDFRSLHVQGATIGWGAFADRLAAFSGNRMFRILGVYHFDPPFNLLLGAVFVLALAAALVALLGRRTRLVRPERRVDVSGALLMLPSAAFIFSLSAYADLGSPRYHLPLVPVAAVFLGLLTKALTARIGVTGWIPVAALVATHLPLLPRAWATAEREAAWAREVAGLHRFMEGRGLTVAYASPHDRWLNFEVRERALFVPLRGAGYRPHGEAVEAAPAVAVLNDYGGFQSFLGQCGGTAEVFTSGRYRLHHALRPPAPAAARAGAVLGVRDAEGADLTGVLTDFDAETGWTAPVGRGPHELVVEADPSSPVLGVRLVFWRAFSPGTWRVCGWPVDGEDWVPLIPSGRVTPYHWSGDRVYGWGSSYRLEGRFPEGAYRRFRIALSGRRRPGAWMLQELQLLEASAPVGEDEVASALAYAADAGIQRILTDRWLTHVLRREGRFEAAGHFYFTERERAGVDTRLRAEIPTAFVVPGVEADALHAVLAERGVGAQTRSFGSVAVIRLPSAGPESDALPFEWRGWGLLKSDGYGYAQQLLEAGERRLRAGAFEDAVEVLREARRARPLHPGVADRLVDALEAAGETDEAARLRVAAEADRPDLPVNAVFPGRIVLDGVSFDPGSVRPGDRLRVRYHWQVPPGQAERVAGVFVHFAGNGIVFQDDHAWTGVPAHGGHWVYERSVQVPRGIAPGRIEFRIGLLGEDGRRIRVRGGPVVRRRSVRLREALRVEP